MTPQVRLAQDARDLSDWTDDQVRLIKTALRDYKNRTPDGGRSLSWQEVQADIRDVTGVDMGGKDTLRQFVEGGREAPAPERRSAIVRFLTDADIDVLSPDEFHKPASAYHAPTRLLQFLGSADMLVDSEAALSSVCGSYIAEEKWPDSRVRVTLSFSNAGIANTLHVRETFDCYPIPKESSPRTQTVQPKQSEAQISKRSTGWCVLTPEDNILAFMKDDAYGLNHYYHLISDLDIWELKPAKRFVFLRYDRPFRLNTYTEQDDVFLSSGLAHMRRGAFTFKRIEPERSSHGRRVS